VSVSNRCSIAFTSALLLRSPGIMVTFRRSAQFRCERFQASQIAAGQDQVVPAVRQTVRVNRADSRGFRP